MSDVEFLVKLRDAAQMVADAANEQLEKQKPAEAKRDVKDFDGLFWENKNGAKGPFQRTSKRANNNHPVFEDLQKIIKDHNGFVKLGNYSYWFDNRDPNVIDRRSTE